MTLETVIKKALTNMHDGETLTHEQDGTAFVIEKHEFCEISVYDYWEYDVSTGIPKAEHDWMSLDKVVELFIG